MTSVKDACRSVKTVAGQSDARQCANHVQAMDSKQLQERCACGCGVEGSKNEGKEKQDTGGCDPECMDGYMKRSIIGVK